MTAWIPEGNDIQDTRLNKTVCKKKCTENLVEESCEWNAGLNGILENCFETIQVFTVEGDGFVSFSRGILILRALSWNLPTCVDCRCTGDAHGSSSNTSGSSALDLNIIFLK